ncbi:tRNA:m(4)X modification enzyme TRM13 homolog isoform X1 [Polypterus senegalus]|uniref:tRNA:m(4)X modification enzyme TRM13 homolog isoform X1 n=1 Tax=Polypterus senegalus TaxID=55291 RepID=UPI00196542BB|nr:tRNA:m(4)X modification enzyme TRM13 homolog isoform X1 [Polypterus senegalus]
MAKEVADGVHVPLPGRCSFYVDRKKRFCKMIVAHGKTVCGEHMSAVRKEEGNRKRIPCPLDPKHTVFEDKLEKHLKKCNSREKPKPVYFIQNINAGQEANADADFKQIPLASRSKEDLASFIKTLKQVTAGLNGDYTDQTLSHPALQEALSDNKNGDSAIKHLKQQASLLGNMDRLGLLGPDRCFVEFGAGRGKLSHWVDIALRDVRNVHFLLVERATTRFKVDGKHQGSTSVFERLQVDIQHLCLSKVPLLVKERLPVIGIGKHLCGAATDLALRCLLRDCHVAAGEPSPKRTRRDCGCTDPPSPATQPEQCVSGVAIALCCHHRCDWKHYVGQEFFKSRGLGAEDFGVFQRMSSWATCGMRGQAEEFEEHDQDEESVLRDVEGILTPSEREHLGRLCKLLIDQGRVQYLRERGYDASLMYYTSPAVSLENVVLTAVPVRGQEAAAVLAADNTDLGVI